MNQPRQCPGCKNWYAPHVEKCECGKSSKSGGLLFGGEIGDAIPYPYGTPQCFSTGDVTPRTDGADGTTGMCEEGKHIFNIGAYEVYQCKKCGHFIDVTTS